MSKATTTNQLRSAANRAQGYAADVAAAAAAAIEELEASKADKRQGVTATLSALGWSKEETAPNPDASDDADIEQSDSAFPFYYDIAAQITADDQADVYIARESMTAARACGFGAFVETLEGKIRVRAQLQPDTDILVQCSITKGVTQ